MLFHWLIDQVPFYVWAIIALGGFGALMWFFYPVLMPLWNALPGPVKAGILLIVTAIGGVLYGRYKGAKDERDMQQKRDANAIQDRENIHNEVKNLSDDDLDKRFDKWVH
jgi:hypothetical protein